MTAVRTPSAIGLVIAEVSPHAIAMARNAPLIPSRFGSPKLTLLAPQVELTRSSSRSRPRIRNTWRPAVGIAPIGISSGSTIDVLAGDAVVGRALDDALRDTEPDVRVLADPGLVVADRDDRGAVLLDERQHALQPLLLAGHAVHERLAAIDREPGLERLHDRRVDRQRQVGERLDELNCPGEDRRLVGERDAGIDVEHVRAGVDLGERIALDPAEVAVLHLLGEELPPGRVDPLADDHERPVIADHDLARRRSDDGAGHARSPSAGFGSVAG